MPDQETVDRGGADRTCIRVPRVPAVLRQFGESVTQSASLLAEPKSVGEARRLIRRALCGRGIDRQRVEDVLLVTSELASNAIRHGSSRGDRFELEFRFAHDQLCVCVRDAGRARSGPRALALGPEQGGGRGLAIVSRLARWSEHVVGGQREVCAEMDL